MDIREFTNSLFGAMTVLVDTETKEPWFFGTEASTPSRNALSKIEPKSGVHPTSEQKF